MSTSSNDHELKRDAECPVLQMVAKMAEALRHGDPRNTETRVVLVYCAYPITNHHSGAINISCI